MGHMSIEVSSEIILLPNIPGHHSSSSLSDAESKNSFIAQQIVPDTRPTIIAGRRSLETFLFLVPEPFLSRPARS